MVTAELACSILLALLVLCFLVWGIYLVAVQIVLVDATGEIARQAARGDSAAVRRAEAGAPEGTRFTVSVRTDTTVRAELRTAPFGLDLPPATLRSVAVVLTEPGVARSGGGR